MRTSRKEVDAVFKTWASAFGFRVAKSWNDVGAYRLDHNPSYGGYRIEAICTPTGGVLDVTQRASASTFVYGLRLAMRSLEERQAQIR